MKDSEAQAKNKLLNLFKKYPKEMLGIVFLSLLSIVLIVFVVKSANEIRELNTEYELMDKKVTYMFKKLEEYSTVPHDYEVLKAEYDELISTPAAHLKEIRQMYYEEEDREQVIAMANQFAIDFPDAVELREAMYLKEQSQAYYDAIAAEEARKQAERDALIAKSKQRTQAEREALEADRRLLDQQEDIIEMMLEEGYDYEEAIDAAEALEYGDVSYEDFF